jgi:hypothetical protein
MTLADAIIYFKMERITVSQNVHANSFLNELQETFSFAALLTE